MTENGTNLLLERLVQQHGQSLEELTKHQQEMFAQLNERHNELVAQVRKHHDASKKDIWDRLAPLTPIISAAIIALTGAYFTYTYNQQQLKVQEIQTIERFLPHLVGDEKSKRAAILAMSSLGNAKLAAKVASIFASEGTASALTSIAKSSPNEDKAMVSDALYSTLDALAQRYRDEHRYQDAVQTYKRALALKEAALGKNSPEVADDIDKLADLYDQHGDKQMANSLRAQASGVGRPQIEQVSSPVATTDESKEYGTGDQSADSAEAAATVIHKQISTEAHRQGDAFSATAKQEPAPSSDM